MKPNPSFAHMLVLVRGFVSVNNLSARGAATVLGVSFSTVARWIDPGYNAFGTYARVVRRVTGIIEALNAEDETTGLYASLAHLPAAERAAALSAAARRWRV